MAFFKASKTFKPSGTKNITTNGTHDVTNYASASVNVSIRNSNISDFDIDSSSNISTLYPVYLANLKLNGIYIFIAFSREDIRDYTFTIDNGTILDIAPSSTVDDTYSNIFLKACICKPTSTSVNVDFKKNGSNPSEPTSFIWLELN